MTRSFSEIVVEGPFMLVKGFLVGFLSSKSQENPYFFHRKAGIKRDTLRDFLKELFELDSVTHLCLLTELVDDFVKAAEYYTQITGMKIQSIKPIKSANFSFAYEFYNEELTNKAKGLLENIPDDITISDYQPFEQRVESGVGMEAYAPLHEFTARGKGQVEGNFASVIDLYLKIKRSDLSESIITSKMMLNFSE